jgi:phosphatidylinositol glycan class W
MFKEIKSSSILMVIGILRLISLKSTDYVEHVSEYGVHWNFLFTLVVIKLLACPFDLFIRKSSIRSFLIALILGFYYQYFLSFKNYTGYMLSNTQRKNLIDANKEGIFSCVGYLSIYLFFQSICLRLRSIIQNNKKSKNESTISFKASLICVINLVLFLVFFYFMLDITRTNLQDVSRRLCNIGFIFYIVSFLFFDFNIFVIHL